MEVLWTSYGIPMEQHATNTPATRPQHVRNRLVVLCRCLSVIRFQGHLNAWVFWLAITGPKLA
jgi:hypothetical protein